uniref:Serine/threonine-protein phosphatase 2A activator n=1 Tax=Fagus sylvatica TaxID=28930 RepID=A0A2N9EKV2_FAGSY
MPSLQISTTNDLSNFLNSDSYNQFVSFLSSLNSAVKGISLDHHDHDHDHHHAQQSPKIIKDIMSVFSANIDLPSDDQLILMHSTGASNNLHSFHSFQFKLQKILRKLMLDVVVVVVVVGAEELIGELSEYFFRSFGDTISSPLPLPAYSVEHELHFLAWTFCLSKIGIINDGDYIPLVSIVFVKYFHIIKKIMTTFKVQHSDGDGDSYPAYPHLPFLWGSSSLIGNDQVKPATLQEDDYDYDKDKYLFFPSAADAKARGAEAVLNFMIKLGLDTITWQEVNEGIFKDYTENIMGDMSIMNHFLTGSIIHF